MARTQFIEQVLRNKELRPEIIQSFHPNLKSSNQVASKIVKLIPWWLKKYEDIQNKIELITLAWYWMEKEEGHKLDETDFFNKFLKKIAVRMHNIWLTKLNVDDYQKTINEGKEDSQ